MGCLFLHPCHRSSSSALLCYELFLSGFESVPLQGFGKALWTLGSWESAGLLGPKEVGKVQLQCSAVLFPMGCITSGTCWPLGHCWKSILPWEKCLLGLYSCCLAKVFSIKVHAKQVGVQHGGGQWWWVTRSVCTPLVVLLVCFVCLVTFSLRSLCIVAGGMAGSCTKPPFLSYLLKSHVTVGQKQFSLLAVRERWNGWWI